MANVFKDFSRNREHEIRQALILDEPNVNTSNGENCIRYLLPRIINKTNHTIVTMVDTYSYQGFVNFDKNDIIGHYIEKCSISNSYIYNHTQYEWLPLTYSEWVSVKKPKINKKEKIYVNVITLKWSCWYELNVADFFATIPNFFSVYILYPYYRFSDWPDIRF